jgi:hypothetical protein
MTYSQMKVFVEVCTRTQAARVVVRIRATTFDGKTFDDAVQIGGEKSSVQG